MKRINRIKEKWASRREAIKAGQFVVLPRSPAWLRNNKGQGKYEVLKDVAAIVRKIFKLYLAGNGSFTIAAQLNREKVSLLSPGRKNCKLWHPTAVQRVLKDKAVIGACQYVEPAVEKFFPAIVSEADFCAAHAKMKERRKFTGRRSKDVNILGGLLKCEDCGGNLIKHGVDGVSYLICANSRKGTCSCKSIRYHKLDDSFTALLREHGPVHQLLAQQEQELHEATKLKLDELEGRRAAAKAKAAKLFGLIDGDPSPSQMVHSELKMAEVEIAKLNKEIQEETMKKGATPALEAFDLLLKKFAHRMKDPAARLRVRELVRSMVDKLVVKLGTSEYTIYFKGIGDSRMYVTIYQDGTHSFMTRSSAAYELAMRELARDPRLKTSSG